MGLARKLPEGPAPLTVEDPGDIIMAGDGLKALYYEGLCQDCRDALYGDTGRYLYAFYPLH